MTMSWYLAALIAATPIGLILVLMLFFRWSAARAGSLGFLATLALALYVFDIGAATELAQIFDTAPSFIASGGAILEAVFTAATILWIIFGALCLHHMQMRTGAIDVLRDAIGALSTDPRIVAILIAWFFALFVEGAAGFGTSVALAAPVLVSFGFRPITAVTTAMIGHSVGVSFGAVGTPIIPQAAVTAYSGLEIARATGLYHGLLGWVMLVAVMIIVHREFGADQDQVPEQGQMSVWPWVVAGAACFLVPMFALSRWVGPELPTLAGALLGGAIFIGILHAFKRDNPAPENPLAATAKPVREASKTDESAPARMSILAASSPYLVVIALILVTRLVSPIQHALQSLEVSWTLWETFTGAFQPLYHPGTILVVGFLVGGLIQRANKAVLGEAARAALGQLVPVTIALVAMLGISRLMVHASMISALAEAAASGAGAIWPFLSPFVGVLGTFVTGSATASNILFTDFQQATAQELGLDPLRTLGAQGFGAAVGNIICPHNIIAGCATVGIAGQEGQILKRTLGACLVYAALGGIVTWILIALG